MPVEGHPEHSAMIRKLRDFDAEARDLEKKAKQVREAKLLHHGELIRDTGLAAALSSNGEAMIGALLDVVDRMKAEPKLVKEWANRGRTFRESGKRKDGSKAKGSGKAAGGSTGKPEGGDTPPDTTA